MGETSASALRQLAAGKPTIVSDVGAFSELPDDCCYKVHVGDGEEDRLTAVMLRLATDADERLQLGDRAQRYIRVEHSVERSATEYIRFIRETLGF